MNNLEPERKEIVCKGCGKDKGLGLVVCWECFRGGLTPFKYFNGSVLEWLKVK